MHYDLKLSKIKGLTSPNEDDAAVNKAYMDKTVQELRNEITKVHSNVKIYSLYKSLREFNFLTIPKRLLHKIRNK